MSAARQALTLLACLPASLIRDCSYHAKNVVMMASDGNDKGDVYGRMRRIWSRPCMLAFVLLSLALVTSLSKGRHLLPLILILSSAVFYLILPGIKTWLPTPSSCSLRTSPFLSALILSWVLSLALPTLMFTLIPLALPSSSFTSYLLYCPRWAILIQPLPPLNPYDGFNTRRPREKGSPFFPLPPTSTTYSSYKDIPPASFAVLVVTGASSGFFDRLENMVGSVHTWAPGENDCSDQVAFLHLTLQFRVFAGQRVHIYDLGFTHPQAEAILCWQDVLLIPFPFHRYPPHVSDITNYAFKALAIQLSLDSREGHLAVLWIDSGLELRAPMFTLLSEVRNF